MNVVLGEFSCPFALWRPEDGKVFDFFAYDTETTDIDNDKPSVTPAFVVGAASNGERGVFITRENVLAFFQAHQDAWMIMHNAAYDLKVTAPLLGSTIDIYRAVERNQVWDTMILKRLLSLATQGHTARNQSSLADCAGEYLGVNLDKEGLDAEGKKVRTSFGQFLGKPFTQIPEQYLQYLAADVLATWGVFGQLNQRIREVLRNSMGVWGFVNKDPCRWLGSASNEWLRDEVIPRFGPLTHHVQLRASILMDVLTTNGIGVDRIRRETKAKQVSEIMESCKRRLRERGFLVGEKGSGKAMQSILNQFHREHPDIDLARTDSDEKWSTKEEDLAELALLDPFFRDDATYQQASRLFSNFLAKMGPSRIHPKFGYLLQTGRTYCSGFTMQNLPAEKDLLAEDPDVDTVRGCFVPGEGKVFIDCDYGQIELVVLAYALVNQFGLDSQLARLINTNHDVHRLIAATVLGKDPKDVTKAERNSAKPVSFGRPGGMGVRGLRNVAKSRYGIDLTEVEVQQCIDAYHRLCPELDQFLKDEMDAGAVIAAALHMTPSQYCQAIGKFYDSSDPRNMEPTGWLGGMLLKVLGDENPLTERGAGRPYTPEEIAFFWDIAQHLPLKLKRQLDAKLRARQADKKLREAVRTWAGRRSVFTVNGRLRANATFCSSRNCIFQGVAADGAIFGLWLVWRAGYKIVDFVHDQLVVESPADDRVKERVAEIERLMKEGMAMVVPGMLVKVETVVTGSLNKKDLDPRYDPHTFEMVEAGTAVAS